MDFLEPALKQFLPTDPPTYPLPWNNHDIHDRTRPHLQTENYVRYILDALAGDERRTDLRRVYRFFKINNHPVSKQRTTARWMLIEAIKRYSYILPPQMVVDLKMAKNFKEL